MANQIVYVRDVKNGNLIPIRAYDNGDGTYLAGTVLPVILEAETEVLNG